MTLMLKMNWEQILHELSLYLQKYVLTKLRC